MNKYLFASGFYVNLESEEIKISKSKEEYKKDEYGKYRLNKPYFISCNCSTYFIDGYTDRELEITDNLQCFYSFDEKKVDDWLAKKKSELLNKRDKYIVVCNKLEVEE